MPKKLNEDAILNELHGQSLFFQTKKEAETPERPSPTPRTVAFEQAQPLEPTTLSVPARDTTTPRHHDTVIPRHRDTTAAAARHATPLTAIEYARRAVKQLGKEAATHRFTLEEKRALKAIEHAYQERGVRTSENEITRIAINYILHDYHTNQARSVLAQVLALLQV